MNRGLEDPETSSVRVLAIGSSPWLQRVTAGLDPTDGTVDGPLEAASELEVGTLDGTDCVLTDEQAVLAAVGDECPTVYAVDSSDFEALDRSIIESATDVVLESTAETPSALEHRLRRAVQHAAMDDSIARRETWYETLLEQSSDLLLVTDGDGTITDVGPSVEQVSGYDAETLRGGHITETVHPEDVPTIRTEFDDLRARGAGETTTVEYRCQHANGAWYVHEADLTNRLEDDVVGGVVASVRDVTEYHQVERELDESFKRVTDAFCALDSEWAFTYINDKAASLLDVDQSAALGQPILEYFPELRGTVFQEAAADAIRTQESVSLERYYEPTDCWYDVRIYPSPSGISVYFRDVTDQIERKRQLEERTERLETLVQNAPVVLLVFDTDGTITLAEGRGLDRIDRSSDEIVGESVFDVFDGYPDILDDARTALDGDPTHSSALLNDRVFETWLRPIAADGSIERIIGTAVDVTERAQYQDALNALHDATSHLLTVESKQAACEYMVDVATDVLGLKGVVYRFDDQRNELVPAAYSQGFESAVGPPPRLQPNDSITWQTFIAGTPALFDDVRESDEIYNAATTVRSALYVPIGEHGVLVAQAPEPGRYDDETFELAQLFARTAEAALDRIGRTRRLHGRERELERQNVHLERLNEASRVRQDIEQLLLMADSRAEIERGVCDRLADLDSCSFAWLGEPDPGGNQLHTRARSGDERGYLDAVVATTVDDSAAEPTGRSALTRTPRYVENVADSIRDGTWRVEALSRNVQSVYTVPLVYDDFLYGVLSIYADDRDAFDEPLRSTLAELGETIAYAIDAVKRKTALEGGGAAVELELEFECGDEGDGTSPLCRLADHLGTTVEFEGATIRGDESPTVFAVTEDAVPADQSTGLDDLEGIDDGSVIAETETETLLQLQCSEEFLGSVVDAHGGALRTFVADQSSARAIVDIPETIEIRDVLSGLNRQGFAASMTARREQTTDKQPALDAPARNALFERLTDRQREVVQTAYHSGFFEWPRQTTGEAVADSLDISSPAFHKHVRAVEEKLFRALFDASAAGVN
ncbi:PAS domain-containing protein [Natronorubrum sp. JWXQ-INN-674]|uniref:PAS domain-containing protein n=1 Tax=Natronorubrum halalkaliphilum TaxID=2691917 RepID=A0A6B0VPE7_9EURY|nr:GAF domain-containing protein [Natronorubrum halalkaliphilum]MXV63358.1 PAS domain-containing protein [Natronorubrum halalkaliphilum]